MSLATWFEEKKINNESAKALFRQAYQLRRQAERQIESEREGEVAVDSNLRAKLYDNSDATWFAAMQLERGLTPAQKRAFDSLVRDGVKPALADSEGTIITDGANDVDTQAAA